MKFGYRLFEQGKRSSTMSRFPILLMEMFNLSILKYVTSTNPKAPQMIIKLIWMIIEQTYDNTINMDVH